MNYPEAHLERVPDTPSKTMYFANNAGDLLKNMLSAPWNIILSSVEYNKHYY